MNGGSPISMFFMFPRINTSYFNSNQMDFSKVVELFSFDQLNDK